VIIIRRIAADHHIRVIEEFGERRPDPEFDIRVPRLARPVSKLIIEKTLNPPHQAIMVTAGAGHLMQSAI
jgi:hypothetical protein